jgi:hypothetical protein
VVLWSQAYLLADAQLAPGVIAFVHEDGEDDKRG